MALSLEKFAASLAECGVLSEAELSAFRDRNAPADAEQLARALVKQKVLTAYQAQQVYAGKARSLVMGNYLVLDKLGQGGMGMVLKARHKRMNRLVALKVLSPTVVKTSEALARFHREVQAAAKLQHPNIVMAFDADEANSTHFLVMEYVEGADLSALIKKSGPLPVDQAINHVTQAARGLEFAHKHGVIHRDIKPANLLLDAQGTVKILDMGLARIEGETGANAELTSTGAVMGTVDYMAPEQALSTKTADARSDIYSLGITLWYLLTARPAYEGDSLMARLMAHANSEVPSLQAARPEVSDRLDAVYQKMVAKKPGDRFQTMTEVLAALETCRPSRLGDTRITPAASAGPSEDSRLSEMLALFGGGADPTAVTQAVTARKATGATRPAQGSEFEKTVTSALPDTETDPTTLTSLRKTTGPQRKAPRGKRKWWQDPRLQIGGGLAAILFLVLGFVFTRSDPPATPAAPDRANLAIAVPSAPKSPKTETPPVLNPAISPQPAPLAPPRLSLVYDGSIRARVPSLDVDRTKPYTVEAWATPQADYPNGSGIVFLTPGCGLVISDDRWTMQLEMLGFAKAEKPLEKNRRVHVAGVRSEKELILFVDGIVVARSRIEMKALDQPANFYLGTFLKYGYKGLIDEVRVSSGERYRKEFIPADRFENDDQTIALYHFDEGQGSDFRDSSGNGHHGFVDNEKFERVPDPAWVRLDSSPAAKPPGHFATNEWIDVIPLIDPKLDKRELSVTGRNQWHVAEGELKYTSDDKGGFLLLPVRYHGRRMEFELDFTRTAGPRSFIFDLPDAKGVLPLHIDKPGSEGGIYISKFSDPQAELIKRFRLVSNKRTKLGFRVTRDGPDDLVELAIDGKPAGRWSGDLPSLAQPAKNLTYNPLEQNALYVHAETDFTFHSIRVRMLDGGTAESVRPVAETSLPSPSASNGWIPLFDGKTLNGWEIVGEGGWSAADGVLKAAGTGKGWIGTSRTFKDYELELEYRIQSQGNGGIALRAWKEGGISAKPFFEVQILDDEGTNLKTTDPTGSITGHAVRKPGFSAPLGEWNKVTVRLEGKHALVRFNGVTTVDADIPIERLEGMIGLQVWDRPVEYRNIRVRELNKP